MNEQDMEGSPEELEAMANDQIAKMYARLNLSPLPPQPASPPPPSFGVVFSVL